LLPDLIKIGHAASGHPGDAGRGDGTFRGQTARARPEVD
jgi:hypothetical protein